MKLNINERFLAVFILLIVFVRLCVYSQRCIQWAEADQTCKHKNCCQCQKHNSQCPSDYVSKIKDGYQNCQCQSDCPICISHVFFDCFWFLVNKVLQSSGIGFPFAVTLVTFQRISISLLTSAILFSDSSFFRILLTTSRAVPKSAAIFLCGIFSAFFPVIAA